VTWYPIIQFWRLERRSSITARASDFGLGCPSGVYGPPERMRSRSWRSRGAARATRSCRREHGQVRKMASPTHTHTHTHTRPEVAARGEDLVHLALRLAEPHALPRAIHALEVGNLLPVNELLARLLKSLEGQNLVYLLNKGQYIERTN
jgi:hypothetical protein